MKYLQLVVLSLLVNNFAFAQYQQSTIETLGGATPYFYWQVYPECPTAAVDGKTYYVKYSDSIVEEESVFNKLQLLSFNPADQSLNTVELPVPEGFEAAKSACVYALGDGNLWIISGDPANLIKFNPNDQSTSQFSLDTDINNAVVDADGKLNFTDGAKNLCQLDFEGNKTCRLLGFNPVEMILGADGNFWAIRKKAFYKFDFAGTVSQKFKIPQGSASENYFPNNLVLGPKGRIWFRKDPYTNERLLGRVSTDGQFTEVLAPEGITSTEGFIYGPDNRFWYTCEYCSPSGNTQLILASPKGKILKKLKTPNQFPGEGQFYSSSVTILPTGNEVWYLASESTSSIIVKDAEYSLVRVH